MIGRRINNQTQGARASYRAVEQGKILAIS